MLCSSCSIRRSNKNIRGDTTMTQQGITETRMHSDSNLDSHHYINDERYSNGNRFLNVLIFRMDVTCADSYCSYFIYY